MCVCVARRAVRIRQRDAEEKGDSLPIPPLLPSHFCFSLSEGKEFWRCTTEFLCNLILFFFCPLFLQFLDRRLLGFCGKRHWEEKSCEDILLNSMWIFIIFCLLSTSFSAKICWICFSVKRDISKKEREKKKDWIHLREAEHLHGDPRCSVFLYPPKGAPKRKRYMEENIKVGKKYFLSIYL